MRACDGVGAPPLPAAACGLLRWGRVRWGRASAGRGGGCGGALHARAARHPTPAGGWAAWSFLRRSGWVAASSQGTPCSSAAGCGFVSVWVWACVLVYEGGDGRSRLLRSTGACSPVHLRCFFAGLWVIELSCPLPNLPVLTVRARAGLLCCALPAPPTPCRAPAPPPRFVAWVCVALPSHTVFITLTSPQ